MADLADILKAAPIGLFMLFGSYFAARRRESGARRAAGDFPLLATRLGVRYRPSSNPGGVGSLSGTYEGHDVYVDPDDRPRIVVYFPRPPAVVIRTYEHEKRAPSGLVRFDTGDSGFDAYFKERYAAPGFIEALHRDGARRAALLSAAEPILDAAAGRAHPTISHVSITGERIECAFEVGRPPYIPASVVEQLLPAVVRLSTLLETTAIFENREPAAPAPS